MQKRWSKTEIAHLERHASSASSEDLAQKFQTDVDTVQRKLDELRGTGSSNTSDKDLETYTEGQKLLYDKKWEQAAKLFERLLEQTDSRHFADRVRQSLAICQHHLFVPKEGVDPYLAVVYEKNSGNLETALELCLAQGQEQSDERYAYLLASIHSMAGDEDKALDVLKTAIRLDPKNRIHAYHDPDFADLRGEEDFTNLISGEDGA